MLSPKSLELPAERVTAQPGEVLLVRGTKAESVIHVESGRVSLGVMENGVLEHRLGLVDGPLWLDVTSAVLNLHSATDAVAENVVTLRRLPLPALQTWMGALPPSARTLLQDIALAHRQQTELAVSRLAKDAEARCAEWLLLNAEPVEKEALAVRLKQRKRLIAAQLGIAPETLSRVLRHLRERGLISGSGRVLNLIDPQGLQQLAGV